MYRSPHARTPIEVMLSFPVLISYVNDMILNSKSAFCMNYFTSELGPLHLLGHS